MPPEELPPDPDIEEVWQKLPQNQPSKQALPPIAGGFPRWLWWLIGIGILGLIGALLQGGV